MAFAAVAQISPGTALNFDGTNGYATVPHAAALNGYPFTVSAWIRTTNVAAIAQGIVSKYVDASFNGWSLHLVNGRVNAWYLRTGANYILGAGGSPLDGGFVADGRWHHVAFTVGTNGGVVYVDGSLKQSVAWTGPPGPVTTTQPVQFGRYHTYAPRFRGDIDEVTLWNENLSAAAVNYVKHRSLSGSESGLLGLWRLDEGGGAIAADASPAGRDATLVSSPEWVPSSAPIALAPVAGGAIRLDGVSGIVTSPHDPALNAFPITVMAWIKTTQASGAWPGIITKYQGNSANGWALGLNAGRLAPWYYRSGANYVEPGFTSASDRFVADGQWHHVAFVVDASSGRTYIDGALVNTQPWVGPAGPTTSTEELRMGNYPGSPLFFNGQIDHASIWSDALTTAQIQGYANLPLTGVEPGLVAGYEMDEADGDTVNDITGLYHAAASGGYSRAGSLARIGDGSAHLLTSLDQGSYGRLWAIRTSSTVNTFPVSLVATMRRFHDFGPAPAPIAVSVTLSATLEDDLAQPVGLNAPAQTGYAFNLVSENANAPATVSVTNLAATLQLDPLQLASASSSYRAVASMSHTEDGGPDLADGALNLPLAKLLHFSGSLLFGTTETVFSSIANTPLPGLPDAGGIATLLLINNNSGYLVAKPSHHFGNGLNFLNVDLFDDGHAEATSGTLVLSGPVPDREIYNGITFDRSNLTIGVVNGIRGTVTLRYPFGFSTRTGNTTNRLTSAASAFPNVPLDDALIPQAATLAVPGPIYGVEETKPFWMAAPSLTWDLAAGQLTLDAPVGIRYTRQIEEDELKNQAGNLSDPLAADRISNDEYFRNAINASGPAVIRADGNGAALLSVDVELREHELRPHFPYVARNAGGHIPVITGRFVVTDDLVDTASSYLFLAGPAPIPYARDCADKSCAGLTVIGAAVMPFTAENDLLQFTRDGGLLANGVVPPQNLTWGYLGGSDFAQRTSDVEAGAFHMPGTFLRGDQTALALAQKPAALLFTGVGRSADPAYTERPGNDSYFDGEANYAGLNFRAPAQGHSILATKPSGWYPLIPEAKYYARFGGISGIHQAETFPSSMRLHGYDFTLVRFAVSYQDSENFESRTDGAITFPTDPAGFVQEFSDLKFLCRGGLESATVPPGIADKHLNYWNVDFKPLTMQFRSRTNDASCNPTDRKLVLGVETHLPLIPEAFQTALGFQPNGNLVVAADGVSGVDSRFPVPALISLRGPGGSFYKVATASDGYFNNWETPGRPAAGFYNIAGRMDVFFFEDVKVHLHLTATSSNSAEVAVMGGWRALDKIGKDLGWSEGTANFFNKAKFDPSHRGFPAGVSITDYRESPTEVFHPRAQKDWIEVAKFDYPLVFNKTLRQFSSFEDSKVVLPIIDVGSRLKSLTPGNADIDFSQDLELKLPRIKALDFVNDAVGEISAPLNSLSTALSESLGGAVDASGLTRGFQGLQHALRDRMDDFLRPALNATLDPVVDRMYPLLSAQLSADPANFLKTAPAIIAGPGVDLKGGIRQLTGAANVPGSVIGQLDKTLNDVDETIDLMLSMVGKDGAGRRPVVRRLIQKIAEDQGPALGLVANIGDALANQLLADLEPTLAQLETDLRDMRRQFAEMRSQAADANGDFRKALVSVTSTAGSLDQYQKMAVTGLSNLFAASITPAGDYFTANPAATRQAIRERLIVSFLGSTLPAKYQETFRQFLYDDDALLNTLLETLFQQVNQSIRNAIASQLASATDGKYLGMKGPGVFSDALAAAKIRGAPTFNGDALKKIRLDADVKLNLGDEIKFTAYMLIKELDSQSTPIECIPAGAPAAEVTIGARDVPLDWAGLSPIPPDKMTLSVEARWTLQSGSVIGIGGMFDVKGRIGFKGCSINEIGATLAIGEIENFFGAKAAGTITILGIPVDVTAGIFVGHACSLEPLIFIDPEAPKVLDNAPSFTGIYVQFGGSVSLSEILFGTSSCVLDIEAGVTSATYYMSGPRSGKLGMRQKTSIEVELICLISAHVDLALFSSIAVTPAGLELTLGGEAEACIEIGPCPFCIEACVDVTVKGVVNDGGIDYSVEL